MKTTRLPPLPAYDNGRIAVFSSFYQGDALTLDAAKEYAIKGIKLNVYELVSSLVMDAVGEITEEVRMEPEEQKEHVKRGMHSLAKAILEQAERAATEEYCRPLSAAIEEYCKPLQTQNKQTRANKQIGWVVVRKAPGSEATPEYTKFLDCYSKALAVIRDWKQHVKYKDYEMYPQAVFATDAYAPVLVAPSKDYLEAVKMADLAASWLDSNSHAYLNPEVAARLSTAIRNLLDVQVGKVQAYLDVKDTSPRPRCVSKLSYVSVADVESGKIADYTPIFSIQQASAI